MIKTKNHQISCILMQKICKKLPIDGFKWEKNMLKSSEDFIKNYDEDSDKGYIFEVDVN